MIRRSAILTSSFLALSFLAQAAAVHGQTADEGAADLVLRNGRVWTGVEGAPYAEAVAARDGRIVAVGTDEELAVWAERADQVIDLEGGFVSAGFIDNHTHFQRAGQLLLGINLLDVSSEEDLAQRVVEADGRLPAGAWIIGGDWGAYEEWEMGSAGEGGNDRSRWFAPHRGMIDSLTADRAILLRRWDGSTYLANGRALEAAGIACGQSGVDCEYGEATGRLSPDAARRVQRVVPVATFEQRLAEARVALTRLAENGVTGIHDITGPEQMRVFQHLRDLDQLTVRVYARPTLDRYDELASAGIRHGFGDDWLRIGGLKGFVDGIMGNSSARFYEPYLTSGETGSWRTMMTEGPGMRSLLFGADSTGHWPQVHAIGDHAIDTLLTLFEEVYEANPPRERRYRIIHTQVISGPETARRMAALGLIAEVQPYHAIDDMRWMGERIGDRSRWAYAFRTLDEAGVRLSFGSDWPGTNASWYPARPVLGIYAAVTRRTLDGEPAGGWYPEERVEVGTALRAYTINNAFAEGEEANKGTIEPGKLADFTVLDRDPFAVDPFEIRNLRILWTIVGGRVTYQAPTS